MDDVDLFWDKPLGLLIIALPKERWPDQGAAQDQNQPKFIRADIFEYRSGTTEATDLLSVTWLVDPSDCDVPSDHYLGAIDVRKFLDRDLSLQIQDARVMQQFRLSERGFVPSENDSLTHARYWIVSGASEVDSDVSLPSLTIASAPVEIETETQYETFGEDAADPRRVIYRTDTFDRTLRPVSFSHESEHDLTVAVQYNDGVLTLQRQGKQAAIAGPIAVHCHIDPLENFVRREDWDLPASALAQTVILEGTTPQSIQVRSPQLTPLSRIFLTASAAGDTPELATVDGVDSPGGGRIDGWKNRMGLKPKPKPMAYASQHTPDAPPAVVFRADRLGHGPMQEFRERVIVLVYQMDRLVVDAIGTGEFGLWSQQENLLTHKRHNWRPQGDRTVNIPRIASYTAPALFVHWVMERLALKLFGQMQFRARPFDQFTRRPWVRPFSMVLQRIGTPNPLNTHSQTDWFPDCFARLCGPEAEYEENYEFAQLFMDEWTRDRASDHHFRWLLCSLAGQPDLAKRLKAAQFLPDLAYLNKGGMMTTPLEQQLDGIEAYRTRVQNSASSLSMLTGQTVSQVSDLISYEGLDEIGTEIAADLNKALEIYRHVERELGLSMAHGRSKADDRTRGALRRLGQVEWPEAWRVAAGDVVDDLRKTAAQYRSAKDEVSADFVAGIALGVATLQALDNMLLSFTGAREEGVVRFTHDQAPFLDRLAKQLARHGDFGVSHFDAANDSQHIKDLLSVLTRGIGVFLTEDERECFL